MREQDRKRLAAHLRDCDACSLEVEQIRAIRTTLSGLPRPAAPDDLRTALMVLASQERQAVIEHSGSYLRRVFHQWRMRVDAFMRPLTIPATGGILSSVVLFGALALTISTTTQAVSYDVPLFYTDRFDANLVPMELRSSVILTLSLDGTGRITDYSFQNQNASFVGDTTHLQAKSISLPDFPSVVPQPISRDISIKFIPIVYRR
jgi:hypothetical protein